MIGIIIATGILIAGGAGFYFGFRTAQIRALRREAEQRDKLMLKLAKVRHDSILLGIHEATAKWAEIVAEMKGQELYGFARCCDACGKTNVMCMPPSMEYYHCRRCGHRNPSPNPETHGCHG